MGVTRKVPVHLGDLSGPDGNALVVLGRCRQYWKEVERLGLRPPTTFDEFYTEATDGDYEHLLATVEKYCDDLDESITRLRDDDDDDTW